MNLIDKFSLQKHEGEYEDWPLKSSLYYCGKELGVKVSGYVIERQFELNDYFLLLLNWDCPFEEGCEIVVINKDLNVVGSHSITPFYNSYNLHDITELSKDRYRLTFNESECFELMVYYPKKHFFSKVVKVTRAIKSIRQ